MLDNSSFASLSFFRAQTLHHEQEYKGKTEEKGMGNV